MQKKWFVVALAVMALAHSSLETAAQSAAPIVADVFVTEADGDNPAIFGSVLIVGVTFSEGVLVTGSPRVGIEIGAATRYAPFVFAATSEGSPCLSGACDVLLFRYLIQASDTDMNGVSIPRDALDLNGGAIRDADGNAANLDLGQHAITDAPDVRVDGSRSHEPGTVERVGVSSSPQNGQSYGAGETIRVVFEFNRELIVTGAPIAAIEIGDGTRYAMYGGPVGEPPLDDPIGLGPSELVFVYAVQVGDYDADGISISADAIDLNGGAVVNGVAGTATPVAADLSHAAVPDQAEHMVDARQPVPAIPFFGVVTLGVLLWGICRGGRRREKNCASVAAILFIFLLTAFDRPPAFAQDLASAVVVGVGFDQRPQSGGYTYGPREEIRGLVKFNKPVVVTGEPGLILQIGDQSRSADLLFAGEVVAGEGWLLFRYFVKASDRDDDGISIPANALRLNRGAIRDSQGNDADLTHDAVPDDPERKVNGRLDAVPTIRQMVLPRWSQPRQGDTFGRGESLLVIVVFSEPVDVTGSPQLNIQVGTQTRQADLHAQQNGHALYFEYAVQASDVDADGFSVPSDALTLNGGSIRDGDGNDADLTHDAVPDDPERKVNGAADDGLAVRSLAFARAPGSQDTYVAGETIFVEVVFTGPVHVTGTPQLTVQVGAQARRADHLPARRAAQLLPPGNSFHAPADETSAYFQYVVQPSDIDDDGVSVPANSLNLNGGLIQDEDGNDANLDHDGLADDPRRKVDGRRADNQAPTILSARILEAPVGGTFGGGDTITVRVTFNEGVTVTGAPRFALRIGANTRYAAFRERWGTPALLFDYVVEESDRDDNGLSIAADAIDLNGGTIRDNGGNDADLDLGYHAFSDDPNYKVNGRLTPVPAVPLSGVLALLLALLAGGWRRSARGLHGRR